MPERSSPTPHPVRTRTNVAALSRRDLIKMSAAATASLAFSRLPVMAGPFSRADFDRLVPADKKLSADWVKSLFARGTPEVLRGSELQYVGMPIGGIGAGHLYLSGDGRLAHWDIFNQPRGTGDRHYARPFIPESPLRQAFTLRIGDRVVPLDATGFPQVTFRGEYPIGLVTYDDPGIPLAVNLEAFSPFIPLQLDDSALPATVLQFTVRNTSAAPVRASFAGELENAVCLHRRQRDGLLHNRITRQPGLVLLECSAEQTATTEKPRPELTVEDWSRDGFEGWTVEGTAFGSGPVPRSSLPAYQGDVGGDTARIVNSHATAPGGSIPEKDGARGKLSREFTIERKFVRVWIGGGRARAKSRHGVTLLVDDQPLATLGGDDANTLRPQVFDVRAHAGKRARIEIVDDLTGGWGNIGVGRIVQVDDIGAEGPLAEATDFGTLALALLDDAPSVTTSGEGSGPLREPLIGRISRELDLAPGASARLTFVVAWHFPNLTFKKPLLRTGRYYAAQHRSAGAVVRHIARHLDRLSQATRLWRDTWYDSTLPYWFLDRTMLNTSILATSTCYLFEDGRFYGWEGVGCCAGTCGHVYHYAHAPGRLFPEIERRLRERVDLGLALNADGAIRFRGECNDIPAIDSQAGTILRALRDHQMTPDHAYLQRNWPGIKRATEWLLRHDSNRDGLIDGPQHNTLDTEWYGQVAWLSGLFHAALLAAAEMAGLVGDKEFAQACRERFTAGRDALVRDLFDGEYFINQVDPAHLNAINSGTGCHIDQVMGQSWAFQVGLPRVTPEKETLAALRSLWRYNFSPDVGPYRKQYTSGRWYAMPGEAGLLMCSFPRKDWDFKQAAANGRATFAGYFNECMNGFEYQVAGHMIWEGMVQEGLAITRAVHDRYHASRRNPWNEIECGDHYARSMASYGVYLAACGFEYDGPRQHIGFAPRLTPENFKCAFTAAKGWGSFSQNRQGNAHTATLEVRHGVMDVTTLALAAEGSAVTVQLNDRPIPATLTRTGPRALVTLNDPAELRPGQRLTVKIA
jgi:uncharacterized protein (DUF608 family)